MRSKVLVFVANLFFSLFLISCKNTVAIKAPAIFMQPACASHYDNLLKMRIYTKMEIEPEFPGGQAAYQRFLNRNLRYPLEMKDPEETDWKTMSNMKFIVDTNGQIINPVVHDKEDTTLLNPFEKEVLRIIRLMPKWKPGMCHGKEVAAQVNRSLVTSIRLERE